MTIRFLGQPFPGAEQIGGVLRAELANEANDAAWFLAAWGKQSGLSRIAAQVEQFRARGGQAEAVLGVDEGGATVEGLRLAHTLFSRAWVFHDPGPRTFHPKMYVFRGESQATAVIGSGNLTKGGLFTNYETAVRVTLKLDTPAEAAFLEEARAYFETLVALPACLLLTDSLIDELADDPRILLVSERRANKARSARRANSAADGSAFGNALTGLLGAPAVDIAPISDESNDDDDLLEGSAVLSATDQDEPGFFKVLSKNDVSLKGSPGQIIIPIAFVPFFGSLSVQKDETETGGPRQSHREFPLTYLDGSSERQIETGRVILYEPAKTHRRRNNEVRFTFRNRGIHEGLARDDVLAFGRRDGGIVVERHPAGWRPNGISASVRYGLIQRP